MKVQFLGAAFAVAMALLLLWLRELILNFRRKLRASQESERVASTPRAIHFDKDIRPRDRETRDVAIDSPPSAHPVQIGEFLAELRSKSARSRAD